MDFRRVRGKNPNALRGTRPISTGAGKLSICTQDSGFQTRSPSTSVDGVSADIGSFFSDTGVGAIELPFKSSEESLFKRSVSGVGRIGRPLTEHESTGRRTVFRLWMLSLGQNPLAFRNIAGWQPYLMVRLVMVSVGWTWWMYTSASSSCSVSMAKWLVSPETRRLCRVLRPVLGPVSAKSSASRFFACTYACRSSLVPAPISGVDGADGPQAEGVDVFGVPLI